jgi:ribosomal protein S18 acetylase RimI-like enzyme
MLWMVEDHTGLMRIGLSSVADGINIIEARQVDLPGVQALLRQKPGWPIGSNGVVRDQSLVAVDAVGRVLGWLMGNHDSQAWTNIDGYNVPEDWQCSYITWLLVDEKHRSSEIGSRLLRAFEEDSCAAGNDTIVLSPSAGDDETAVISFYEKNGYRRAPSGQMHRGPHGPTDHFPLQIALPTWSDSSGAGGEAILEYKRRLGSIGCTSES